MTGTTHATGELGELARDLRASAAGLEGFVTVLRTRTGAMAWRGGNADRLRADVALYAQLTGRATALLHQLASRMTALEDDAQLLRARLVSADQKLQHDIRHEVRQLEAYAASHPGAPLPQNAVTWLEGAVQASGTLAADAKDLEAL